jgi:peptidoglycan/xylan/chitin deacetylase (PgdA/CDA1 family)
MTANGANGRPAAADHYRYERYVGRRRRSPLLAAYYAVKPVLPRRLQLALRRAYAVRQAACTFPAWPQEPVLVDRWHASLRAAIDARNGDPVPLVAPWPYGHRFACVLTHDVEGTAGVRNVGRVLEVERRHDFVSSWNFVAEWYPIPDGTFEMVREAGGEVGLHAIKHDGRLFQSRARFEAELPKIHAYLEAWGAEGFRSPATGRNAEWMHELRCGYDSSFPDTDPFEPQPGGCCSIWPFFFGDVVELPITLVQDHTLFEIIRNDSNEPWESKSAWLMRNHGLINLIAHPDYLLSEERLARYEAFLRFLRAHDDGGWFALPRDVARWWRARAQLRCVEDRSGARLEGPDVPGATIAWATLENGELVIGATRQPSAGTGAR